MNDPRVGVVLLTHNRRDDVLLTVARMRAVTRRLVIVDNASADGTAEALAGRFPDVEVVRLADNRGAAGRNAGVARLQTPYVAFCDDDTWWSSGMLERAADALEAHPTLGLVTGTVLVEPGGRLDPTCLEMAQSPLLPTPGLPGRPVLGFLCAATMVRRDAFLEAGGFEPRFFLGGEEALLAIDLATHGWALAYIEEVVVHHQPSPRRDSGRRRGLLRRNALWTVWLRRPLSSALRVTASLLRSARRDGTLLRTLRDTLAGSGWVARHRRVVPTTVELGLRALDGRWRATPVRQRARPAPVSETPKAAQASRSRAR